ncbi:MAG: benzoyl-CoA reductase, bzd-type, subunit N [Deltaproteobacteria bacterium]|nr:benzoyl-CoA reductase, bzd-type, subunit N [Deltaproteobacteria bacterium]
MFRKWTENRHEYAKNWKEKTGGKVLGYFCTYVPEEILYAADILPVRILGSHEPQSLTEPHIFAMYCPFCRDCLAQGLKGRFDYLDGIMISQSCLHIRQAFTSWQLHIPVPYGYYLPMPHHIQSPRALPFFTAELVRFKESVEKWTGRSISDDDLQKGIEIVNNNRRLMEQFYLTHQDPNPKTTGLESMYMVLSGQMVDKQEHSRVLEDVLAELPDRDSDNEDKTRLMILGSENDDTAFIEMVESLNAIFVIDDHCTGSRYFLGQTATDGNPLEAIADRYIQRPPCPTKDWPERRRKDHTLNLAKTYNVAGAILAQQKFCDPHELDFPILKKTLEENGIKTLTLEFDVTVPIGQFKVRVEAFLEILWEEDLF